MKTQYFHPDTIAATASAMLAQAQPRQPRRIFSFNPSSAALLVLDMQNYFLHPASHAFVPSAPAILPGLQALIAAFAAASRPIVFTQHHNTPANAAQMSVWWRDLILPATPAAEVTAALDTSQGLLLSKTQYDAFYQTSLLTHLQSLGVQQLVITGLMTHLCCETTARSAFIHGFQVFFPVDATATYNQAFHLASLTNLGHGFAQLPLISELLTVLTTTPQVAHVQS